MSRKVSATCNKDMHLSLQPEKPPSIHRLSPVDPQQRPPRLSQQGQDDHIYSNRRRYSLLYSLFLKYRAFSLHVQLRQIMYSWSYQHPDLHDSRKSSDPSRTKAFLETFPHLVQQRSSKYSSSSSSSILWSRQTSAS